jgi:hypothetical protein
METDEEVALIPDDPGDRDLRIRETTISRGGTGNRSAKVASQGALCPPLNEISVPTRPSFVLCPPVLKQSLTAGCNGEVARGFGRCCWESYLEALFSFSPTGCPDSKPYSERPPLTTGRMHLEFAHFPPSSSWAPCRNHRNLQCNPRGPNIRITCLPYSLSTTASFCEGLMNFH